MADFIVYLFFGSFFFFVALAFYTQSQFKIHLKGLKLIGSQNIFVHRLFGWIAIGSLVLIVIFGIFTGSRSPDLINHLTLLHIPPLTVCAIVKLRKNWNSNQASNRVKGNLPLWWGVNLFLGTCFFAVTLGLINWNFPEVQSFMQVSQYKYSFETLLIGHIGLAVTLILIGRSSKSIERFFHLKVKEKESSIPKQRTGRII
jgi:hypothetical protein